MPEQLPELVLAHGAWHGAGAWEQLLPALAERGWTASAIDLPSAGSKEGVIADGEVLRARLEQNDAPKVVVGHSYGGTVITQAGAHETVVGLAYICAARPDVGDVVWTDPHSPDQVPYWIRVDDGEEASFAEDSKKIL